MTPEQREWVTATLRRYGAELSDDGFISRDGKKLARLGVRRGRLRVLSGDMLLASYPASTIGAGVADFVRKFWFWKEAPQ